MDSFEPVQGDGTRRFTSHSHSPGVNRNLAGIQ